MATIPVFLPGEFHGQRSLVDYSPVSQRVRHDWGTNTVGFPGGSDSKESACNGSSYDFCPWRKEPGTDMERAGHWHGSDALFWAPRDEPPTHSSAARACALGSHLPSEGQGPTGVWPKACIFLLYHQTSFHKRRLFQLKPRAQRRCKTGWESGLCSLYANGEGSVFRKTQIRSRHGINPTGGATQLDIFNPSYLDKH